MVDDRETILWRCWSLTPCFLAAIRDSAPSHECTQLKHQYLQNTTFEFGSSKNQVSFTESPTDKFLIHVAGLMSEICNGVQVQWASMSLGTAVWSPTGAGCTPAPFPTPHWKWPLHGRTSSSCEGKSKKSIPYFSVRSPLLLVALSGDLLLVVFILKSDFSNLFSPESCHLHPLECLPLDCRNPFPFQKSLATDSSTTEYLQCPWMCFGCLKFKGTAVKWDDNCAVSIAKEN